MCALPPLGVLLTIVGAFMHPIIGGMLFFGTSFAIVAMLVFLVVGETDFRPRTRALLILWNASPVLMLPLLPIEWSWG